jgi:hypothetical protein
MSRYLPVDSFNTGSIPAGTSVAFNRTIGYNSLNIVKMKVVPSGSTIGYKVQIFKDAARTKELVATKDQVVGSFYAPTSRSGGEVNEGFVAPYEDLDGGGQLHFYITNHDTVARSYAIDTILESPSIVGVPISRTDATTNIVYSSEVTFRSTNATGTRPTGGAIIGYFFHSGAGDITTGFGTYGFAELSAGTATRLEGLAGRTNLTGGSADNVSSVVAVSTVSGGAGALISIFRSEGVVISGGTHGDIHGMLIDSNTKSAGTISGINYGLKVRDQNIAGIANYGVHTGLGPNRFGDTVTIAYTPGGYAFRITDAAGSGDRLRVRAAAATGGVIFESTNNAEGAYAPMGVGATNFSPITDNATTFGTASFRISNIYSVLGTFSGAVTVVGDISARTGGVLNAYSPDNSKLVYVQHNGTLGALVNSSGDFILSASAGNVILESSTGVTSIYKGSAAQEFRVYGTTTGPKYASLKHDGSSVFVGSFDDAGINFLVNNVARWSIASIANGSPLYPGADNTYAIGDPSFRASNIFSVIGTFDSYLTLLEMASPGVAAANRVRIYAKDNGSGKTQLMCIFQSGAEIQLAIEP